MFYDTQLLDLTKITFSRSFKMPPQLDQDKIEAHVSEGVLKLVLPQSTKSLGRRIKIKEAKKTTSSPINKKSRKKDQNQRS